MTDQHVIFQTQRTWNGFDVLQVMDLGRKGMAEATYERCSLVFVFICLTPCGPRTDEIKREQAQSTADPVPPTLSALWGQRKGGKIQLTYRDLLVIYTRFQ